MFGDSWALQRRSLMLQRPNVKPVPGPQAVVASFIVLLSSYITKGVVHLPQPDHRFWGCVSHRCRGKCRIIYRGFTNAEFDDHILTCDRCIDVT